MEEYRIAIQQYPEFPLALNNLAGALYASGRLEEATATARESARIDADYAPAHWTLAMVLLMQGILRMGGRNMSGAGR